MAGQEKLRWGQLGTEPHFFGRAKEPGFYSLGVPTMSADSWTPSSSYLN